MRSSHRSALLILSLLTFPSLGICQSEGAPRTLFGGGQQASHGGWGGVTATYTRIMDSDALLVGARAGWLIDHRVTIGFAGHGLVTDLPNTSYDRYLQERGETITRPSQFEMGYGGLLIEPIIAYSSPIHVSLPIIVGAGGCGYQYSATTDPDIDLYNYRDLAQAFAVVEPGVELELNVLPLLRFGVGASYRFTSDLNLPGTSKDALNGLNAGFSIKLGRF